MTTCRSCGAEIEWARFSSGGKRVPLDPPGDEPGNLVVLGRQAGLPIVTVVAAGLGDRTSHFATCPDNNQWRKRS